MRSYEEMAQNVINAHDDYIRKKEIRKKKAIKSITAGAALCFSFAGVMFVWNQVNDLPKIPITVDEPDLSVALDSSIDSSENSSAGIQESKTEQASGYTQNSSETTLSEGNSFTNSNSSVDVTESISSAILENLTTAISSVETTQNNTATSTDKQTKPSQPDTTNAPTTNPTNIEEKPTSQIIKPTEPSTTIKIPDAATGTTAEQIKPTNPTTETPAAEPTTKDERDECTDNHVYLKWDEMTINQQYFLAEYGDPIITYSTLEKEVSASEIGEYICSAHMTGYDWYELNYHYCNADAYKIKGDDNMTSIAIKFSDDDNYYLYSISAPNDAELDG